MFARAGGGLFYDVSFSSFVRRRDQFSELVVLTYSDSMIWIIFYILYNIYIVILCNMIEIN